MKARFYLLVVKGANVQEALLQYDGRLNSIDEVYSISGQGIENGKEIYLLTDSRGADIRLSMDKDKGLLKVVGSSEEVYVLPMREARRRN